MLNKPFYHSLTLKYITMFGNLFNDITVTRLDANNKKIKTIPISLKYASREKYLALLDKHPQTEKTGLRLPAISFVISSMQYDGSRQISPLTNLVNITDDSTRMYSSFQKIPYEIQIEMALIAEKNDDLAQMFEQIIPYFTPTHVNTITLVPDLNDKNDILISLDSTNFNDSYDGEFTQRRELFWTLTFTIKAFFIGPISQQGVIKRVQVDLAAVNQIDEIADYDKNGFKRDERIVIKPGLTPDGKPTTNEDESINYLLIQKTDPYGFIEDYYTFIDEKVYNPKLGIDL
jgi:hypothetical protein